MAIEKPELMATQLVPPFSCANIGLAKTAAPASEKHLAVHSGKLLHEIAREWFAASQELPNTPDAAISPGVLRVPRARDIDREQREHVLVRIRQTCSAMNTTAPTFTILKRPETPARPRTCSRKDEP
jgi:hypothetical protein